MQPAWLSHFFTEILSGQIATKDDDEQDALELLDQAERLLGVVLRILTSPPLVLCLGSYNFPADSFPADGLQVLEKCPCAHCCRLSYGLFKKQSAEFGGVRSSGLLSLVSAQEAVHVSFALDNWLRSTAMATHFTQSRSKCEPPR